MAKKTPYGDQTKPKRVVKTARDTTARGDSGLTSSIVEPLSAEEKATYLTRKKQLKDGRVNWGIEPIWKQAEADYVPHELGKPKKKVLVENERTEVSSYVNLDNDEWRSKMASNDPYIKIQTAISILFDNNPEAVFDPASRHFEANTKLIEQLYHRSWSDVKIGSHKELRKFIFNLSQFGWSAARRYYRKDVRKGMNQIKRFDLENNTFEYEKKDVVDLDDVFFQALSPFDVWIDDTALPDDPRSRRDWMWREVWGKKKCENVFGDKISKLLTFTTYQDDTLAKGGRSTPQLAPQYSSTDLATIYFYENRETDQLIIESNDIILRATPLPTEKKELSLVDTYWTLRSIKCPFGIGLNEIMRNNKVMYDRVRNMSMDQVVLSIYKMFFYSQAENPDDEGGEEIRLTPGRGKKVIDPKNIAWSDIPGPGKDSYIAQDNLSKDMESDTGIGKTLGGEITGKTAFEIAQAKEGSLKRLATPLRNIKAALEWDAVLCVNLQKMIYSVPKVIAVTDPEVITNYIASVNDNKELYFMSPAPSDAPPGTPSTFNILQYREFQLGLEMNNGTFAPTQNKQFFMPTPSQLDWEGQITIRVESMLEQSKSLERQDTMAMSNLLIPMFTQCAANPAAVPAYIKPIKEILKAFDKNPQDWVPDAWLADQGVAPTPTPTPLPGGQTMPGPGQAPAAPTVVPSTSVPDNKGTAGQIAAASQRNTP